MLVGIDIAALTRRLLDTIFCPHRGDFPLITLILQLIEMNLLLHLIVIGATLCDFRKRARRLKTQPAAHNQRCDRCYIEPSSSWSTSPIHWFSLIVGDNDTLAT